MITLYTFATPNGHKASVLLEELGLTYKVHKIDVVAGENRHPDYLAVSPIGKVPAVVEDLPAGKKRRLFGSGAILLHYAERTGRLLPDGVDDRAEAMSWFQLGISDLGPTAVDMFRFSVRAPEKIPYAIDLFKGELVRCYTAMEARLAEVEYLAGTYSIADIACYPFIAVAGLANPGLLERYPNMKRWHDAIAERPAVKRGMAVPDY
ncbi:glutathione S-transferase family protein [Azospirillum rugosum]|uniref:GST-like protein n=1 Tax=Azospirillum rugosum TaxID=416170 RepID=A0ABS4SKF4_9PROT|nr:glutathione S-transferase C-terminal domain-containing protein [Azospirillum rugosum]MBP2293042.1 GST-like protein [Azospirillum rugosum]MDQ0526591.1 GST-like protein [Azospirillum rugosum]